jgi:hypothetical protein
MCAQLVMRFPIPVLKSRPSVLSIVAISALIASGCALWSISSVSLMPPKLKSRDLRVSGATTAVLVGLPHSLMADPRTGANGSVSSLAMRGELLARLATTRPALQYIGSVAGVSPERIAAVTPPMADVPFDLTEAGSEQRAWQLVLAGRADGFSVTPRPGLPIIEIYSHAPSPAEAARVADAVVPGLRRYLEVLARHEGGDLATQVTLRQLGPARAGVLNGGVGMKIAVLTFLFAFAASCGLLLVLVRLLYRRTTRAPQDEDSLPRAPTAPGLRSGVTFAAFDSSSRRWAAEPPAASGDVGPFAVQPWQLQFPVRRMVSYGGDWPRTTRVMPWMLALFMALLWLVPFDSILLNVAMPVDMRLDRVLLPFVAGTWLLLLAAGGRGAPRIRGTKIHVAVILFVAIAFLSVLLNVASLNQSLEIDTSFKKLPLLLAYLSLFFMVSSVIRVSEVRAFLTYTLGLAVVCAIGMIVEHKTHYNVFFDLSSKLLPGVFKVTTITSGVSGRDTTHGPTVHGLAAATMLSMAFAIAIVRLMHARRGRMRVLYGLAAGALVVGMLATQKKTGLLAPIATLLALAWFQPRQMRKLAPIAILAFIALLIVSPGTIKPVTEQLSPHQLGAGAPTTTTDRASRWDAVRPDVWTHPLIGRGYGSYIPPAHRILDSEILAQTIETGVLGLASFFLLGGSVIVTARAPIKSRDATRAPPALVGAAAAVVFLAVGPMFDSLSFPQVPYIFLYLAGLVAVIAKPVPDGRPRVPARRGIGGTIPLAFPANATRPVHHV